MVRCKYTAKYNIDFEKTAIIRRLPKYECPHEAIPGRDYCIFHDEEYQRNHPEIYVELERKFFEEIKEKVENNEPIICIGYTLPRVVLDSEETKKFFGTDEFNLVVFDKCKFDTLVFSGIKIKTAHFKGVKFGNVDFSDVAFENAYFTAAKFHGNSVFRGAEFKSVLFDGLVEFRGEVDFIGCNFDYVSFGDAFFHEYACFAGARFKRAYFTSTKFNLVDFSTEDVIWKAKFEELANFENAIFFEKANFKGVEFSGDANFSGAEFNEANFSGAIFKGSSYFGNTTFKGEANFESTNFNTAHFVGAKFVGNLRLVRAKFSRMWTKYAKFDGAKFDLVEFKHANISELFTFKDVSVRLANFFDATIGKTRIKIKDDEKEGIVIFKDTTFLDPEDVIIYNFKPSKFSFLGTCIEGIQLIYIPEKKEKLIIFDAAIPKLISNVPTNESSKLDKIKKIIKVILCEESEKSVEEIIRRIGRNNEIKREIGDIFSDFRTNDPSELENKLNELKEHLFFEYKSLRKAFEDNKYYVESSSLFKEEMRMLRERSSSIEKVAHYIYAAISCYGESIGRPIIFIMIPTLLGVSAWLYFSHNHDSYLNYVENVTKIFFQMSTDSSYGILDILIRILGAVTLGLLFIAFRRRFERK